MSLIEGRYATGELAFHIPELFDDNGLTSIDDDKASFSSLGDEQLPSQAPSDTQTEDEVRAWVHS
jgi:hypothetical protein